MPRSLLNDAKVPRSDRNLCDEISTSQQILTFLYDHTSIITELSWLNLKLFCSENIR
ncbi:MAG: hypothetical protein V7L22_30840 [Nostoc sp.]|uniref:hypothetical protein n=1 Tax=Nostoc sp. TaxID=1180 RepID=UPI002FFC9193